MEAASTLSKTTRFERRILQVVTHMDKYIGLLPTLKPGPVPFKGLIFCRQTVCHLVAQGDTARYEPKLDTRLNEALCYLMDSVAQPLLIFGTEGRGFESL